MSMFIGEALVGEGNEVAHIDLMIGSKDGPVGNAFAIALANQKQGHSNLLAVLTPNLLCKPATVLITKVTIKGAAQAVQMFDPARHEGRTEDRRSPGQKGHGQAPVLAEVTKQPRIPRMARITERFYLSVPSVVSVVGPFALRSKELTCG